MTVAAPVVQWLAQASAVTVLTGAGISTDSGIPDFRGPNGVWTRDPGAARMFTIAAYVADPQVRRDAWQRRRDHPAWAAQPNAAHRSLTEFAGAGRLRAVVTQNIDGLHQRAGMPAELVIELHGTLAQAQCLDCGDTVPMTGVLDRVAAGEADPPCRRCGGILKSATVSFGQPLDRRVLGAAVEAAGAGSLFLAIGTSLTVQPAAGLVDVARRAGARLVIVNAEPTPYDDVADAVLRDRIGAVIPALVSAALARMRPS